jgi:hypothetical protein
LNPRNLKENMKELKKEKFMKALIPGIITGILITVFLSGKIVAIPKGTQQGGIISAIGVFAIILSVFILTILFSKIRKTERN